MYWLLIGAALVLAGIGFSLATLYIAIDLLRVVDEKGQSLPSDDVSGRRGLSSHDARLDRSRTTFSRRTPTGDVAAYQIL
jgi:hypothetical protein